MADNLLSLDDQNSSSSSQILRFDDNDERIDEKGIADMNEVINEVDDDERINEDNDEKLIRIIKWPMRSTSQTMSNQSLIRASLSLAQKHKICLKKATEPSIKNKELAKLFDVSEGCISNTLKNLQKWLKINPQAPEAKGKRQVKVIFPEIEEALTLWQGEAASAPLEKLDEFREELQDLIRRYSLDDVFNCDETGLYWKIEPKRTISNKPSSLPVEYYWNVKAWMQVLIWNDWIRQLDATMRLKGRKILLLVDNAPVHALYKGVKLTNIEIKFLPLNTTAHLQPCDKGIINSFKAHYQKLLLQNRIKAFDFQQETGNSKPPINIKKAIKYVVSAWNKVLLKTIFNCWKDAGILPLDDTDSQDGIEENEHEEMEENERSEIQGLIDKLEYAYPLTAEEYIRIDQENEIDGETPTEEQIVAILKENNSISDDESDREITLISSSEVLAAFDKIFIYLEQNNNQNIIDKSAIDGIGNMNREGVKDNIIDVDNINFETSYFNESDIYNHEEEYEGFIEYQIDQE
ncbi:tigger transposable element-derived protein 6-like [Rhizophagus clarus]|uniref:Tigger transposable element-derived protein 6-like n=1 Tax=Rhizophagus clarus TaxID=94130 RepID=A0A8H3KNK9_9GLOM|nr:tigger transposable element-derived protein 6-like [Rhizophagus clarus]